MNIFYSTESFPVQTLPIALTIGNFDGVHLGHQAVLDHLKNINAHTVVFTFPNHPSQTLGRTAVSFLTSVSQRMSLLEQHKIDSTLLIPFTKEFSNQTALTFLSNLKKNIPFSYLVLGHDSRVGSDRLSDLTSLCSQLDFKLEYLPPFQIQGKIVSSSAIRQSIQSGKLSEASQLLGRPYSILGEVKEGNQIGRSLGFRTLNLNIDELIHPPFGVYIVKVRLGSKLYSAIANLGKAPTVHLNRSPILEVHLLDHQGDIYGKNVEIIFVEFVRQEKKFSSLAMLKKQIQSDILTAKQTLIKYNSRPHTRCNND